MQTTTENASSTPVSRDERHDPEVTPEAVSTRMHAVTPTTAAVAAATLASSEGDSFMGAVEEEKDVSGIGDEEEKMAETPAATGADDEYENESAPVRSVLAALTHIERRHSSLSIDEEDDYDDDEEEEEDLKGNVARRPHPPSRPNQTHHQQQQSPHVQVQFQLQVHPLHRMPRNVSTDESRASGGGGGLWGWFEDHDRSGSTPPASSDDLRGSGGSGGSANNWGSSGGGASSGKRRFGLFQLFLNDPSPSDMDGNKGGTGGGSEREGGSGGKASAMAVTAPTYVLEESLSSQQLWKETAGNRPPQPAEERAFYEKIWAQNFLRSQVSYEMPVEVLTATSPISLSPFADGNFGEMGGDAKVSNYNIVIGAEGGAVTGSTGAGGSSPGGGGGGNGGGAGSGYHNPRVGRVRMGSGPPPPNYRASIGTHHPAEAAAAEASLLQRLGVAGAAQHYNHPHNPRGGKSSGGWYGPHRYHQTKVNQRMGGGGNASGASGGHGGDNDVLTVVVRGDNVFGTTVSKSFERRSSSGVPDPLRQGADTVSVSIASYRVVSSRRHGKYAQFLVIYCEGSFRDTVGVWKRYSDFQRLGRKVMLGQGESCTSALAGMHPLHISSDHDSGDDRDAFEAELLPNAVTSWKLLKKRQRWFRCLDAEYLSLKVFLLERFLHDVLFESSTPDILRDFVGVNPKSSMSSGAGTSGGGGRSGSSGVKAPQ